MEFQFTQLYNILRSKAPIDTARSNTAGLASGRFSIYVTLVAISRVSIYLAFLLPIKAFMLFISADKSISIPYFGVFEASFISTQVILASIFFYCLYFAIGLAIQRAGELDGQGFFRSLNLAEVPANLTSRYANYSASLLTLLFFILLLLVLDPVGLIGVTGFLLLSTLRRSRSHHTVKRRFDYISSLIAFFFQLIVFLYTISAVVFLSSMSVYAGVIVFISSRQIWAHWNATISSLEALEDTHSLQYQPKVIFKDLPTLSLQTPEEIFSSKGYNGCRAVTFFHPKKITTYSSFIRNSGLHIYHNENFAAYFKNFSIELESEQQDSAEYLVCRHSFDYFEIVQRETYELYTDFFCTLATLGRQNIFHAQRINLFSEFGEEAIRSFLVKIKHIAPTKINWLIGALEEFGFVVENCEHLTTSNDVNASSLFHIKSSSGTDFLYPSKLHNVYYLPPGAAFARASGHKFKNNSVNYQQLSSRLALSGLSYRDYSICYWTELLRSGIRRNDFGLVIEALSGLYADTRTKSSSTNS